MCLLSQMEWVLSKQTVLFINKPSQMSKFSHPYVDRHKPCPWLWKCDQAPMMRALMMTSQKGRWQMFSCFNKHHQINPSTMTKPSSCVCWLIHHKEQRGATNKLVQRSGTREEAVCRYIWWIVVLLLWAHAKSSKMAEWHHGWSIRHLALYNMMCYRKI